LKTLNASTRRRRLFDSVNGRFFATHIVVVSPWTIEESALGGSGLAECIHGEFRCAEVAIPRRPGILIEVKRAAVVVWLIDA